LGLYRRGEHWLAGSRKHDRSRSWIDEDVERTVWGGQRVYVLLARWSFPFRCRRPPRVRGQWGLDPRNGHQCSIAGARDAVAWSIVSAIPQVGSLGSLDETEYWRVLWTSDATARRIAMRTSWDPQQLRQWCSMVSIGCKGGRATQRTWLRNFAWDSARFDRSSKKTGTV